MKQVAVFQKNRFLFYRDMISTDVRSYFKSVIPQKSRNQGIGSYCERCGVIIGIGHVFEKSKTYILHAENGLAMPFELCDSCYEDKIEKKSEGTPDLEDIIRFNINL